MKIKLKLKDNQKLLAEHEVDLPDGTKLLTLIIKQGDNAMIVGSFILEDSHEPRQLSWCGYCEGELIGCIDCPNNDPFVNCVTRTVSCFS